MNRIKKIYLSVAILLFFSINAQQKTFCNPINIDYGYTPFEVFSKQGKHRATADPVIVNFQKKLFAFSENSPELTGSCSAIL